MYTSSSQSLNPQRLNEQYLKAFPTVSIAIPTYNESANIERVIQTFLSTAYPNLIEIFIADGGSTDGTQEIVKRLSLEDPKVKLLNNTQKVQAPGLNLILENSTGDIFLRADAHSDYALDYIERCVEALLESDAVNVGGAQRFAAKTAFQAGVALASKSFLGNGGAKYRNPNYDGYAETVYLGCFWKNALLKVSGYNVNASINEDAELNIRLINSNVDISKIPNQNGKVNQYLICQKNKSIYISSKICVWYYSRKTWNSLYLQYFKYGRGRYLTTTKHSDKLQLRGQLPFLMMSITLFMLFVDLLFPQLRVPAIELIPFGLLLPFIESIRVNLKFHNNFNTEIWRSKEKENPSFLIRWFFCGVALITMPTAHFSGYAYQLFRHKVLRICSW